MSPQAPQELHPAPAPLSVAMIGLRGIPASYGGVETAVEQLAPLLVEKGVDVTVYGRRGYVEAGNGTYKGVRLRNAWVIRTKHLEAITHTVASLVDLLRPSRRPDIVHFHATGPALLSFIPRLFGVRSVVTIQGWDWRRGKWGPVAALVLKLAAQMAVSSPTRVIAVSREIQEDCLKSYVRHVAYIPNGVTGPDAGTPAIPSESLEGLLTNKLVLLFLGRLVPEKEVVTLIEAFSKVEGDELRLVVAGPSSHSDTYVDLVHRAAARDSRVHLSGPQYGSEKAWLLSRAEIFVQPSSLEGLPLTLLEAIAHGAYPVVSNIGPHLEAVAVAGATTVPTAPPRDVDALAEAMGTAVGMDPVARRAGVEALQAEVAARYSWSMICERTLRVYEEAMRFGGDEPASSRVVSRLHSLRRIGRALR